MHEIQRKAQYCTASAAFASVYLPFDQHELLDLASVGLGLCEVEHDESCIIRRERLNHGLESLLVLFVSAWLNLLIDLPVEDGLHADLAGLLQAEGEVLVCMLQLYLVVQAQKLVADIDTGLQIGAISSDASQQEN